MKARFFKEPEDNSAIVQSRNEGVYVEGRVGVFREIMCVALIDKTRTQLRYEWAMIFLKEIELLKEIKELVKRVAAGKKIRSLTTMMVSVDG